MAVKARAELTLASVSDGKPGSNGVGIKSTAISYQAGASQTKPPTGSWSAEPPKLTVALPYLWTKTYITYTDGKTSTSYSVSSTLDGVEVGGRNILRDTKTFSRSENTPRDGNGAFMSSNCTIQNETYLGLAVRGTTSVSTSSPITYAEYRVTDIAYKDVFTLSFYVKGTVNKLTAFFYGPSGYVSAKTLASSSNDPDHEYADGNVGFPVSNEWTRHWVTWELASIGDLSVGKYVLLRNDGNTVANASCYVCGLKLERGNKATDWTPAPEDVQQGIDDAQNSANDANNKVDNITDTVTKTSAELKVLSDSISSLVTDAKGQSLMTQTGSGWTFNIGSIQSALNGAIGDIQDVKGDISGINDLANKTNQLANDVAKKTAYINMTQDESGQPVMELGQQNGEFKLRITNTSMDFMQGSQKIAYLSNRQLYIQSSVVTDEMKIGATSGYIWKKRANGNMGLRYVSS